MVEIYSNIDGGFSNIKITGSIAKFSKLLPKVAEVVLIIPHTNAELERLVSIVKYMYMFMYIYIYICVYIYIYIFNIFGTFIYETRWDII